MLTVQREVQDGIPTVVLGGTIEEGVNFEQAIGAVEGPELRVNGKGIQRINSIGIKQWIRFFGDLVAQGIKLSFVELSPALVDQANMISNFVPADAVRSLLVPFLCGACQTHLYASLKVEQIRKLQFKIPPSRCPKCQGTAAFDDVPEEYFQFLMEG